jgi:hypothetical protein
VTGQLSGWDLMGDAINSAGMKDLVENNVDALRRILTELPMLEVFPSFQAAKRRRLTDRQVRDAALDPDRVEGGK